MIKQQTGIGRYTVQVPGWKNLDSGSAVVCSSNVTNITNESPEISVASYAMVV